MADFGGGEGGLSPFQTVDKKLFSPRRGRIALSANERIAEFLDFAIQAKFAYVNKLRDAEPLFFKMKNGLLENEMQIETQSMKIEMKINYQL